MTSYIFQQIANQGKAEGIDSLSVQKDTRTWFRNAAQKITKVNRQKMMNDPENIKPIIMNEDIGKMFMFFYDPKHKQTLPYYDTFPLIFPLDIRKNGYLGINMHYLPPVLRAKLMNAIYTTITDKRSDKNTKLQISYSILASASKYRYFKPCVKSYLWDHVKSQYLNIPPTMWDAALMLPTASFKKATAETVWMNSKEILNA